VRQASIPTPANGAAKSIARNPSSGHCRRAECASVKAFARPSEKLLCVVGDVGNDPKRRGHALQQIIDTVQPDASRKMSQPGSFFSGAFFSFSASFRRMERKICRFSLGE